MFETTHILAAATLIASIFATFLAKSIGLNNRPNLFIFGISLIVPLGVSNLLNYHLTIGDAFWCAGAFFIGVIVSELIILSRR